MKFITMDKKFNRMKTMLANQYRANKWLAEQLGKATATISKWCTNKSLPSLVMMMTIAKLLQVELNDLVRLEEIADPVVKKKKRGNKIFFLLVPRYETRGLLICSNTN